jgi:tetratricopeptide (TPR) repeat protein
MKLQQKLSVFFLLVFLCNTLIPGASAKAAPVIPDGWIKYTNDVCGFTIYLPNESILNSEFETGEYLRVDLPILDAETNLGEKYLQIECSVDPASRNASASRITDTFEMVINEIDFMVQSGEEGAAGSFYQAIKYSAERDGKYATLEFVLRSSQMYDPPLPEFDYTLESAIFEEIMQTFTWDVGSPVNINNSLEGQIAYVGQDGNVYLLRSGQESIQVTRDLTGTMKYVGFSQSGRWLSFTDQEDNLYAIDTANPDFEYSLIGVNVNDYDWANLSDVIAFSSNSTLVTFDMNTLVKDETDLATYSVSWSPGDTTLAIVRTRSCPEDPDNASGSNSQILLQDVRSKNVQTVYETSHLDTISSTEWSTGGRYLFHVVYPCLAVGFWEDVSTIDLSGNDIKDGYDLRLWSQDDKFISARGVSQNSSGVYDSEIYQQYPGSNDYEVIYYLAGNVSLPISLSPDTRTLLFVTGQAAASYSGLGYTEPSFWLIQTNGSNARKITDQDFNFILWSPSGNQILYADSSATNIYSISSGEVSQIVDVVTARNEDGFYSYDVAWGKWNNNPPIIGPITETPEPAVDLCPYANLFNTKKDLIAYLEQPQLNVEEYNSLIPLTFTRSTRGYDESWPKSVVRTLESTCLDYQNGKLTPEEMQAFEAKIPAFTRLTYTEMGIKGLLPPFAQMTYDVTNAYVETAVIGLQLIFSITKIADYLAEFFPIFADPVRKIKMQTSYWILDSLQKYIDMNLTDPANQKQRDLYKLILLEIKGQVSTGRTALEVAKDLAVKRPLAESLISITLEDNHQINQAAYSVYPELAPGSTLTVNGSDYDAYTAIQRVIAAETARADESHQRTEKATGVAEALQSVSDMGEIVQESVDLAPLQFIDGLSQKIEKWVTSLDFFSQWLNTYATLDSGYSMIVIGDRMLKMDKIAFDPSEINNLKDFRGYQPAQVASINALPLDNNAILAPVYYLKNARRFYASIDSYDQRVQEVLTALQTGTDEQVSTAVDNLMLADGEVGRMLHITEKPILGQNANPQVNTFLTSSQNFSSSNVSFQVALMLALANRTDVAVLQQVDTVAQSAIQHSNDLKEQYTILTQPGLDFSITPSVVIANYELPATIVTGAQIPVKITVNNPGVSSFSGNISIRGGQVVSGSDIPAGEILPGQDKVFDIALQALREGDEIVFVDLNQNGQTVDSMMILIQVKRENTEVVNPFSGYLIAGGIGLVCLFGLIVSVAGFYAIRKKSARSPKQSKTRKASSTAQSAAQMKQALEFARAKQYEQAFDILKGIVQSEPQNMQAWFNLGITLGYMGKFKDAEICLTRAKQLGHPKADEALKWIGQKQI